MRRRRIFQGLLLGFGLIGLAEAAVRAGVRLRPLEGFPVQLLLDGVAFDPGRMYRLEPGTTIGGRFPVLGNGFTSPPLRLASGAEGLRVACLGDSTTFGIGAGPVDAYPRRLSDALARAFGAERADVLNAGCPGYSSAQSLLEFSESVAPLRPSVLVAYLGSNNEFARASPRTDEEVLEGLRRPFARLLGASHLLRFLTSRLLLPARPSEPLPDFRERVPLGRFEAHLVRLAADARRAEAAPLFIVPVYNPDRRAAVPVADAYASAVRRAAALEEVPALDPTAEFRSLEPYPLFAEPIHLGRAGHRLLAARLYDLLVTDARLLPAFERAGLAALRAFEALAARAETEAPSEEEFRSVREALAPLRSTSSAAALAHAILSLGGGGGNPPDLPPASPVSREILLLARALGHPGGTEASEEGVDPLPLAFDALARGELARAADRLNESARTHPYRPGIRRLLGEVERLRGEDARAREALAQRGAVREEVVASDPLESALPPEGTPLDAGALLRPAVARGAALLLHRDRLHGGTPALDRRIPRTMRLGAEGRLEEGAALLREALRTHAGEPLALGLLAGYHEMRGERGEAEELWRRSVEVDPGNWNVRLLLARFEFARGQASAALADVERVLEERPEAGEAWVLGLEIARSLGDRGRAERLLRGARDRVPDHPRLREILAQGG
ncbi:MAG TPA: GDSL-type esterase/lipase family protein [Planctomycetota bacterium]|nr:GDSL-type esterase/lipase family protein [Planctomycetota bacterium]